MRLAGCPAGKPRRHGRSAPPLASRARWRCYPAGGRRRRPRAQARPRALPRRLRVWSAISARADVITVLGTGTPLTNRDLGNNGNAALALNLLANDSRIVWLVPGPVVRHRAAGQAVGLRPDPGARLPGDRRDRRARWCWPPCGGCGGSARWSSSRCRSLVRASETAEGHGRLYRSRRARGRAAAAPCAPPRWRGSPPGPGCRRRRRRRRSARSWPTGPGARRRRSAPCCSGRLPATTLRS